MFDELVEIVGPRIQKQDTYMRKALPPDLKLAITLRFLDSEEWASTEEVFRNRWNIPHAVGALDGKRVAINKPAKSGSLYHKGFFSVVLMALVDGNYKFLWVDVGAYGSMSDP
ncbi:uncharacterized protein LOC124290210 [Haliotis rubra]|uniref:uncharacterized protein LOC124290210 n=1 Tax=Haliotis rubra TaxID=36100 RepID=UPI001EE4F995|nr:uncharacterized protein LOC124290210 [Haliotis rubra]